MTAVDPLTLSADVKQAFVEEPKRAIMVVNYTDCHMRCIYRVDFDCMYAYYITIITIICIYYDISNTIIAV